MKKWFELGNKAREAQEKLIEVELARYLNARIMDTAYPMNRDPLAALVACETYEMFKDPENGTLDLPRTSDHFEALLIFARFWHEHIGYDIPRLIDRVIRHLHFREDDDVIMDIPDVEEDPVEEPEEVTPAGEEVEP